MKRFFILFIIFIIYLTTCLPVYADLYVPKGECPDNYTYFDISQINPQKYQKITQVEISFFNVQATGYCVDINEYCSKNSCSIPLVLETINSSKYIHITSVIINLIINTFLIALIYLLSKTQINKLFKIKSVIGIIILTILGYLADLIAFDIATGFAGSHCFLNSNPLCGGIFYKSSFEEKLLSPYSLIILSIALPLICLFVTFNFYKFYSNNINQNKGKRFLYSLIFGLLSNPLWIYLFRIITIVK